MSYIIDLSGKCAVVTGGTRGIGRAISTLLAQAGASVGMIYRSDSDSASRTLAQLGAGGHFAIQADLAVDSTARAAAGQCRERFSSGIDYVVLDAVSPGHGPVDGMDDDDWRRTFDVTVHGHRALLAELSPAMRQGGSVVFISSGAGHDPLTGLGAYGAGKAAAAHMARVLAQEWGPRGIRVNIVSPGATSTGLVDYDALTDGQRDTIANTALRRLGVSSDVAKAVLFFISDLSSFVTGQDIRCNGGRV